MFNRNEDDKHQTGNRWVCHAGDTFCCGQEEEKKEHLQQEYEQQEQCPNCGFVFQSDQAVAGCASTNSMGCVGTTVGKGCAGCYQALPKCPSCGMGLGRQGAITKLLTRFWKPSPRG